MPGSIFQLLTLSLTTLSFVACDLVRLLLLVSRSRRALAAENLFLRKQLALFHERKVKPHRAHDSTRLVMVILGRMFSWRDALVNVQPDTFLRWHRTGFRLFWRWKSRPVGRLPIAKDLRRLIREMAAERRFGIGRSTITAGGHIRR
jgi:putative transposase